MPWQQEWIPVFLEFLSRCSIPSKELKEPGPIEPYEAQYRFLRELDQGLSAGEFLYVILKARQLGMCLDPDTKVLKADLTWVRIGDICPGDEVVAVDEAAPGGRGQQRKMRTATVQAAMGTKQDSYRLTFDDGREVICSGGHRWLTRKAATDTSWRSIEGNGRRIKPGTQVRWITRPWSPGEHDDGWMGGMIDGEGSMSLPARAGSSVCVAQRQGPVWDRLCSYALERGYHARVEADEAVRESKFGTISVPKLVFSRMDEVFRLIGQTRPTRFIGRAFWEGRELPGKKSGEGWATVMKIEPLGERELVDLQTSTGTFIAEGFVSHNSTIMLILDVFWLYMHPGLQGALVADTDENRVQFRETITQVLEMLPKGFRIKVKRHNRSGLVLANGSRLQYMCAGKGKNPDLGRSRGLNFLHATELSSWGDQNGINSLIDTLATENPNRLYILESTAKGYNVFWAIHRKAKLDPSWRAVFIGWWAKSLYRLKAGTAEFDYWWTANPVLDEQEQAMEALILADYGWQMTTEQWAWWRKQAFDRSESNLLQEFPWHEKVAFQVTGSPFFSNKRLNNDIAFVSNGAVTFRGYKYDLGDTFGSMKCEEVFALKDTELRLWEHPIINARYVIGVDVAYGRSAVNDRHCIEIFRCFADKLIQVGEWATSIPETRHVAWVLAHLAGSYRDCMINLEVSGPGLQVMHEMQYLRQQISTAHLRQLEPTFEARNALDQARWFLYHRPDTPGQGYLYNWKTNHDNKQEMFNGLRDSYNTEHVVVRSIPLLEEMVTLVQNGTSISASANNKDDRPFATGLAHYAWTHWVRFPMIQESRSFAIEMAKQTQLMANGGNVVQGLIPRWFAQQSAARRENELQRLIDS